MLPHYTWPVEAGGVQHTFGSFLLHLLLLRHVGKHPNFYLPRGFCCVCVSRENDMKSKNMYSRSVSQGVLEAKSVHIH